MGKTGSFANLSGYMTTLTARPGSLSARNRAEQFEKSAALIRTYRDAYPGAWWALSRAKIRRGLHRFFKYVPAPIARAFLRFYKRFW